MDDKDDTGTAGLVLSKEWVKKMKDKEDFVRFSKGYKWIPQKEFVYRRP